MIRRLASGLVRSRSVAVRIVALGGFAIVLAGCDKCGDRVKFNAPSLPNACGENANPAR